MFVFFSWYTLYFYDGLFRRVIFSLQSWEKVIPLLFLFSEAVGCAMSLCDAKFFDGNSLSIFIQRNNSLRCAVSKSLSKSNGYQRPPDETRGENS